MGATESSDRETHKGDLAVIMAAACCCASVAMVMFSGM